VFSAINIRPEWLATKGLKDSAQGFNPGKPQNSGSP